MVKGYNVGQHSNMVPLKQWLKHIVEHVVIGLLDGIILKIHVRMSIVIAGVDPF